MFPKRLIELRNAFNLTQVELAKKIDVSPSSVGMWESGKRKIMPAELVKLSHLFNVSTDYILEVNDDPNKFDENLNSERMSKEVKLIEDLELYFGKPSVELLQNFMKLNDVGRRKVIEYSDDLAFLPIYRINESDSE